MKHSHFKQGLIVQVLIIVIALIAVGAYFGLDILNFFKKPEVVNILKGIWNTIKLIAHYIEIGFMYVVSLF